MQERGDADRTAPPQPPDVSSFLAAGCMAEKPPELDCRGVKAARLETCERWRVIPSVEGLAPIRALVECSWITGPRRAAPPPSPAEVACAPHGRAWVAAVEGRLVLLESPSAVAEVIRSSHHDSAVALVPAMAEPEPTCVAPPKDDELLRAFEALVDSKKRPYIDPPDVSAEPAHLTLLAGRWPAVEILVLGITDERPTAVTNFSGGSYRVGDLAWSALASMIPSIELVEDTERNKKRFEQCGECAIWDEVATREGRRQLQQRLKQWLADHRDKLRWVEIEGYPPGGRYELREAAARPR